MAKDRSLPITTSAESVISIIGPGMKLVGDIETDGTVRIEGTVEGNVRAGKAVVIGKDGSVEGTIVTQDAVVSGRLVGTMTAESRLELQSTSRIDGDVYARRMQLEEGAILNGTVKMGDRKAPGTISVYEEGRELVLPAV
jgi:cytoskeletal protein CcmA (bactofilin family)